MDAVHNINILWGEDRSRPGNVDVEVTLEDGSRWGATFFTPMNIDALFAKNRVTGECRRGLYFYCVDMIIVQQLDQRTIEETVTGLLEEGVFRSAFGHHGDQKGSASQRSDSS